MIVYEFNGKKECNNLIELQEVLKHRSKGNSNEFELRTELEYPFLTILIKEELACVHYFKDENDCGHYAYTDNNGLEEEYVIFNIGSENAESEISKDLVIPVEQAYIVAIDFFETCEMLFSGKLKKRSQILSKIIVTDIIFMIYSRSKLN